MNFKDFMENTTDKKLLDAAEKKVKANVMAYVRLKTNKIVFFSFKRLVIPFAFSCLLGLFIGMNSGVSSNNNVSVTNNEQDSNYYPTILFYDNVMEQINE